MAAPHALGRGRVEQLGLGVEIREEEASANTKTITVYLVVAANALAALAVMGVFYLVYSEVTRTMTDARGEGTGRARG